VSITPAVDAQAADEELAAPVAGVDGLSPVEAVMSGAGGLDSFAAVRSRPFDAVAVADAFLSSPEGADAASLAR
jgi:hypothetical protein